MRRTGKALGTLAAATSLALVGGGLAFADDISNDLDTTVDAVAETMALTAGGDTGSTILRVITTNGDGKNGCNLTGGTTLTVAVSSSATAVATVAPASLTFTSCSETKTVTVTPLTQGSTNVSLSQTGNTTGATFNLDPATFTVNVAAAQAQDRTAPTIESVGATTNPNDNGWYNTPVTNTFRATDAGGFGAGLASPHTFTKTSGDDEEGSAVTIASGSVTDAAGNTAPSINSGPYKIDLTDPSVTCPANAAFILNDPTAELEATVEDGLSGPDASSGTAAPNVNTLGAGQVDVTGKDEAGNETTVRCDYVVKAIFLGKNAAADGTGLAKAKAGSSIPLKWQITDATGAGVPGLTNLTASIKSFSCVGQTPNEAVETATAGSSGLQDLGGGFYQYNWKTLSNYAGSCRTLLLSMAGDGTTASVQFTK